MRLLGNCSGAGRSGKVPRHALAAVDDEDRTKTVPNSLHCRLRRDQSSGLSLSYAHLEKCSCAFNGVETRRGGQLLHCSNPKFDPSPWPDEACPWSCGRA